MMKLISRVLPSLLLAATTSAFASSNNNGDDDQITTYLLNLGQYLGYNVSVPAENPNSNPPATVSQNLLHATSMETMWTYLYDTFLAAFPVNTSNQDPVQLVQSNVTGASAINSLANNIFNNPAYSSPSATQPSISTLIDQQTYQNDPVSQAVLNILGTPDYSYCLDNNGVKVTTCNYASSIYNQNEVMANVLGSAPGTFGDSTGIPDTQTFFKYEYNQPFISQLNVNSLVGPLVYTTSNSNSGSTSSSSNSPHGQGLTATNQAQQAANFIRYAIGAVAPTSLPNRRQYDSLYTKAQVAQGATPTIEQVQAQAALASYLLNLRIYAAQTSVGIGNLYYILGKRMQQNLSQTAGQQGAPTSQALSEFNMATWRLYNPDQSVNTQWLTQINQASAATVQKEIAGLLAEINYQLYLSRVQQERILLTNTMLLIQNSRAAQPTSSLSASSSATSGE
jgi:intracellular multiplication protein IcmX